MAQNRRHQYGIREIRPDYFKWSLNPVSLLFLLFSFSCTDHDLSDDVMPDDSRFTIETVSQGMYEPMQLAVLDDGHVIIIERRGNIKVFDPISETTKLVATLDVELGSEDGLLGLALDPDFGRNHWIYFFYTPAGPESLQRISRFELSIDSVLLSSESVLLEFPLIRRVSHSAGSLEFGPDGNLYISAGDNTSPFASNGYAPIDEREGMLKFDAQRSAGNTRDLRGKILRIRPNDQGGYDIPEGNLFPADGSGGRPEIYVMGNRNPFRIAIDQKTGYLYWGEVGPDAGKNDSLRGPMGHDEINQARSAGNFGWPYFVADNKPYRNYNFQDSTSRDLFDPLHPVNRSVNNTGNKELPPAKSAFIWYPYLESEEFPLVGTGGRNAMAGPVFYSDLFRQSEYCFPGYFDGKLFIYDWMRNWVMLVTMSERGDYQSMEPFLSSYAFAKPIDIEFGKDGSLYVLEYGQYWRSHNADSKLIRIRYHKGNRQPVARITADRTLGSIPLAVKFSAAGSFDHDKNDSLVFNWIFEGDTTQSTDITPTYTFSRPGVYTVRLRAIDSSGMSNIKTIQIHAGNEAPEIEIAMDKNRSFYWGNEEFKYSVIVKDREDGATQGKGIKDEDVDVNFGYVINDVLSEVRQSPLGPSIPKGVMSESDCKSCHDMVKKSVGPSYLEIARRYKGQEVKETLVQKVIEGGNGKWGEVPMSPHPQLSEQTVSQMIDYILSLEHQPQVLRLLPLKGILHTAMHSKDPAGVYNLNVSYRDRGANGLPGVLVEHSIILKPGKIFAVACDESEKVIIIRDNSRLRFIETGAWFAFKHTDLTGINRILFHVVATDKYGGKLEIRLGSPEGSVVGELSIEPGTDDVLEARITPSNDVHDLYFVFKTPSDKINTWTTVDIYDVEFRRNESIGR